MESVASMPAYTEGVGSNTSELNKDAPVKRGRGRPRLPDHLKKNHRKPAPTGEPRPRGRPKGTTGVRKSRAPQPPAPVVTPDGQTITPVRTRGRPRKSDTGVVAAKGGAKAAAKPPKPGQKKRGRPRKVDVEAALAAAAAQQQQQQQNAVLEDEDARGEYDTDVVAPPHGQPEAEEDDEDDDDDDDDDDE